VKGENNNPNPIRRGGEKGFVRLSLMREGGACKGGGLWCLWGLSFSILEESSQQPRKKNPVEEEEELFRLKKPNKKNKRKRKKKKEGEKLAGEVGV